jgi:hypothetical protein
MTQLLVSPNPVFLPVTATWRSTRLHSQVRAVNNQLLYECPIPDRQLLFGSLVS